MVGEILTATGKGGYMDRDRNFALQQATYGPFKELLQGFLTCKERGTLFTRGIGFNVPLLTGRDCELDTSRTAFYCRSEKDQVTILLYPSHPWGPLMKKVKNYMNCYRGMIYMQELGKKEIKELSMYLLILRYSI